MPYVQFGTLDILYKFVVHADFERCVIEANLLFGRAQKQSLILVHGIEEVHCCERLLNAYELVFLFGLALRI